MAYEIPGFSFSLPAGANFAAANQFRFVAVSNTGTAVAPSANGAAVGVRYNTPKAGEATTIVNSGIVIVESGDNTIVAGSLVASSNVGTAIIVSNAAAQNVLGTALEASAATGIQIAVLLK